MSVQSYPIKRIEISPELRRQLDQDADLVLMDVRTAHEWSSGHVAGALHVPMSEVAARGADLDRRSTIATICEGGYRSSLAASLLARAGFPDVMTVTGGMSAYRARIEAIS